MPEIGFYPESIYATLTLLNQIDRPEQIRDFFKSFHQLYFTQGKVPCHDSIKTVIMEKVKANDSIFGACRVNTLDGLRLEFDDSWMLIRPSGTEPLIRVSAESNSMTATDTLLGQGMQLIEGIVERLTT